MTQRNFVCLIYLLQIFFRSRMMSSLIDLPVSVELVIPFSTAALAEIAFNSLRVDKEPKRSSTVKTLSLENNNLKVSLTSKDTRQLRTALNSFLDYLILVSRTIDNFAI